MTSNLIPVSVSEWEITETSGTPDAWATPAAAREAFASVGAVLTQSGRTIYHAAGELPEGVDEARERERLYLLDLLIDGCPDVRLSGKGNLIYPLRSPMAPDSIASWSSPNDPHHSAAPVLRLHSAAYRTDEEIALQRGRADADRQMRKPLTDAENRIKRLEAEMSVAIREVEKARAGYEAALSQPQSAPRPAW